MTGIVTAIYRYPVKGLSADPLARVALAPGEAVPFDRVWAIENGPGRFDPDRPCHLPKINFLMLMRDERLATLQSRFDPETGRLTLLRAGRPVASGLLGTPSGRQIIEQFIAAYMAASLRGRPKLVSAPGHSFSDIAARRLHVVNLASVRELERIVGRPVDPLRFRPNVVVDGPAPWSEFGWPGAEFVAGTVRLRAEKRTGRCAATNVDPRSGVRDMAIPAVLQREWGHTDFGIYAEVLTAGTLAVGDPLAV
jgi:uncharacterized protein YcbX